MKTVTVLSDTHGNRAAIDKIADVLRESDLVIHLGDTSADGNYIKKFNPNVRLINGNCDPIRLGEDEITLEIEGVNIFACHGHRYSVKSSAAKLIARAKELGCGVALYGHSHRASEKETDGVLAINPGTMSRYSEKSYCYLVINGGKAVAKIVNVD